MAKAKLYTSSPNGDYANITFNGEEAYCERGILTVMQALKQPASALTFHDYLEKMRARLDGEEKGAEDEGSAPAAFAPGATVKIAGVEDCPELVVLENYPDGTTLCLTKGIIGESKFGNNSNYADKNCALRKACENWLGDMVKRGLDLANVKERELNLLSSGGVDYGKLKAQAAPLTLDEYRKYAKLCLTSEYKSWYWLATSAADLCLGSDGSPGANYANYAWYVGSDGVTGGGNVTYSYGVRPALILNSKLLVSEGNEND